MEYLAENWGGFVGVLGVIVSAAGLWYAVLARRAARSAEGAANDARRALSRKLSSVEIERAVALIDRVKGLHRQSYWDRALELYPELRRALTEIHASMPEDLDAIRDIVLESVSWVIAIEHIVSRALYANTEPDDAAGLDDALTRIQQNLETLQSSDLHRRQREG